MDNELSKNIVATVCYFDVLDYPLTSFEIWKYLFRADYPKKEERENFDLKQVSENIDALLRDGTIKAFNGFYFLAGRRGLVEERIRRNKISLGKIKRARRVAWLLRSTPFLRMVGVTGRLAMKNAQEKSDWDFFIVIKKGRIWTGRTFLTIFTHILGKRRYANKVRDRVCLNYFVTDESMEIRTKDLFSANEYSFLFPVFGHDQHMKFQLKNKWIADFKPNFYISSEENLNLVSDSLFSRFLRNFLEYIFDWDFLESWLKKIEKKKIEKNPKTHQKGSLIEASDDALIFLPRPQGPIIFEKFKENISRLVNRN